MALIDVHSHFLTDRYVAAARAAGHEHPDGMPGWPTWSADAHLALMDECGIEVSLLSISSPGTHFGDLHGGDAAARLLSREVNEVGAALRERRPDRFGHFASLPLPDVDGAIAEAARALDELGSDGVTVKTHAGGRYLGDPANEPLWAELDRRAAVVFVHPTSPPGAPALTGGRPAPMLEFVFDTARAFADLALAGAIARHPGIRWIVPHGGGALPLLADRIELFARHFGGSPVLEQLRGLWFDSAGTPFPHQVPTLERVFGLERLLYGSDFCWTPAPAVREQVATVAPVEDLTTDNALRLLPRLAALAR
ncbi:amidohydrolase family protein [Pseudonocardia ailaonensis]|uniref:6-methylsalicylate decarboxylase n=1 Tax=Pseudonocardia ailaonensis TaxID=367279 RepID=A0ABN2MZP0_9PSEU